MPEPPIRRLRSPSRTSPVAASLLGAVVSAALLGCEASPAEPGVTHPDPGVVAEVVGVYRVITALTDAESGSVDLMAAGTGGYLRLDDDRSVGGSLTLRGVPGADGPVEIPFDGSWTVVEDDVVLRPPPYPGGPERRLRRLAEHESLLATLWAEGRSVRVRLRRPGPGMWNAVDCVGGGHGSRPYAEVIRLEWFEDAAFARLRLRNPSQDTVFAVLQFASTRPYTFTEVLVDGRWVLPPYGWLGPFGSLAVPPSGCIEFGAVVRPPDPAYFPHDPGLYRLRVEAHPEPVHSGAIVGPGAPPAPPTPSGRR